jgi:hypothetical protein
MERKSFLTLLATFPPEAWDAVVPKHHYRADALGRFRRFEAGGVLERVGLNPQPLPPKERFVVAAATMTHEVAGLAVDAGVTGTADAAAIVRDFVDDWCGTGWPRRWPWPWPPEPEPDPREIAWGRFAGAVVLASLGARMPGTELGDAFAEGAERLGEVAVHG